MKTEHDEAYILHRRPFKESSVVIECFCRRNGWVSLIARGAKRSRSRFDAVLQPFMELQIEWGGKSELKTLYKAESNVFHPLLKQEKLIVGLYLNELMIRLLQRLDPHPVLYDFYHHTLEKLITVSNRDDVQRVLRQFEIKLLAELGYGLELDRDGSTGLPIEPDCLYSYDPKLGIYEISSVNVQPLCSVSGAALMALKNNDYSSEAIILEAKKFMRSIMTHYLGNKPLETRKLFYPA